jgi:acetolactate synthase I/II/III large subunit
MINIYYFLRSLSEKVRSDDVIVTCAGSSFNAAAEGIRIKQGIRYIVSGGLAPMGYALPASIGVSFALDRRVICIIGDGSFQLNIQELQSVVHYKLPIKIFVLNNGGYLTIRSTQRRYFNRFIGESPKSGISFPDTRKIAKAYGIKFVRVDNHKKLDKKLDEILSHSGSIICEVMMPRDQNIIRPLEEE